MSSAIIRKGDTTSHGGTVLEGFVAFNVFGMPAAGVGHMVYCPRCKGSYAIVQGIQYFRYGGKQVAVDGMKTACGAELQASQSTFRIGASAAPIVAPMRDSSEAAEETVEHWYSLEEARRYLSEAYERQGI